MNKDKLYNSTQISNLSFALICMGLVAGMVGQQVGLPLFIGSFGGTTGPYFIVLWCSFLFNCFFWPIVFFKIRNGTITPEMRNYKKHYKLVLIGVFDALNGILIVYASPLSRTPGALQAILMQTLIPFTIIISKLILKKSYTFDQLMGGGMAILGCIVSLIPKFNDPDLGDFKFYWALIFLIGNIPLVLMNIFEESIFNDIHYFDGYYMLAWESLYQITTVLLLFWTDIIPGFGFSPDIGAWGKQLGNGFQYFFAPWPGAIENCDFCFLAGAIFTVAYCFSYVFGAKMMKIASANSNAVVSALAPTFSIFFWLVFTGLNRWAGGAEYTKLEIICYSISVIIIGFGVVMYRKAEKKKMVNDYAKLEAQASNDEALINDQADKKSSV